MIAYDVHLPRRIARIEAATATVRDVTVAVLNAGIRPSSILAIVATPTPVA